MLLGKDEEEPIPINIEEECTQEVVLTDNIEEAIISMHATSGNPLANTIQFKGQIGQ
jgi:hypothetical protein